MFKHELWQSHDEYRTMVNRIGRRLSRNHPKYFFSSYEKERQMLFNLNLDPLTEYIPSFYSVGGRPAKHQAQILRSLILFTLLFNRTKARTSLTLWVTEVLPNSVSLAVLIGCPSLEELPPLGSYYDFMDRFWMGTRDVYSRSSLLPADKNGKKPKKVIGPDGKLVEPEDPSSITTKDIVDGIIPTLMAGILLPARFPAPTGTAADAIILILMQNGDGTATTKPGISAIPFICSDAGTMSLKWNSPSS